MREHMMQNEWKSNHEHVFGQDKPTTSEHRTLLVVIITAITMVIEISAGMIFGSMALLADGLHMASHAVALGIAVFAYRYARRHATDVQFSFGTGKVNALAGYSGAVLLGVFALGMAGESIDRFIHPVEIAIDQALFVAILGLVVNGASVIILGHTDSHNNDNEDNHNHIQAHDNHHQHQDHNFRSAYFHVLADALTSLLAIVALLSAKYFGQMWLDPLMGVVGAILVAKWSIGLLRESSKVLLDRQAELEILESARRAFEKNSDTKVEDLHVWPIGPGRRAAIISIKTSRPKSLQAYRSMIPKDLRLDHVSIEVDHVIT